MLEKAAASKEITFEEAKQQFLKQAGIGRSVMLKRSPT